MTPITPAVAAPQEGRKAILRAVAERFEAQFLSEMMNSAGVGKPRESLGGGAGEDHFSSFLTQEYASAMVKAGGLGLAETIYTSLVRKEGLK